MTSWIISPLAGSEAAGCTLNTSLTNIQWLGKMSSDGLGSCSIKRELEGKENQHVEPSQVKVNCHSLGTWEPCRGLLRREMDQGAYAAEFPTSGISIHLVQFCLTFELPFCLGSFSPSAEFPWGQIPLAQRILSALSLILRPKVFRKW